MSSLPSVSVHFLPALIPSEGLRGGVAVVVDVLRATTVMVRSLSVGAEAIIPCLDIDEARSKAAELGPTRARLGGERHALPIEGFDFGNSPGSYTAETVAGKTVVMTTTNGTRAILASLPADRLFVASFANRRFTCDQVREIGLPIHVVCSGTDGQMSWEDITLAGAMVALFTGFGFDPGNDEAIVARDLWEPIEKKRETVGSEARREGIDPVLVEALGRWRGAQRLWSLGLFPDVIASSACDTLSFAAELMRDPMRIVRI